MRIPFAVFLSFALALPAFTTPVARDIEDLAARTEEETPIARFAPDESALEARKAAAKAVKPKPAPKPKAKPAKAPVKAPVKAVTKPPAKAPAKPAAKPPVKAPTKPAAKPATKAPVKPAKPPVKAPAKPAAKPAVKAPVKPVAKPPAKAPVKPAAKPPAKAPVKPTAKPATKAPVKPVAKPPVKASAKPAAKPAAKPPVKAAKPPAKAPTKIASPAPKASAKKPTASSARPVPSASKAATCVFKPSSKAKKPTSAKLLGRSLSSTQFHATCKNFASSIKSQVEAGTFTLQPDRIFPNEFTWSGGFYVTPDEEKAQLFGATFLADKCADKGGTVIMEFNFPSSDLKVNNVGTSTLVVNKFRADQSRLGGAITRFLKKQQPSDATPADPPTDDGISKDDNPAPQTPKIAIPTQDQVEAMLADTKAFNTQNRAAFAAMKDVDVVAGAGSLTQSQKITIADAGNEAVGIPPLQEPFNQVVLVTDDAMKKLKFVKQEDLPACLAEKQPKLVAFLKKKGAES
ncbi:hypothetical protein MVEN_01460500 [Mycena venus]|uniref:Uncharacterized protein n=1 Tax=Mycena venus TaxID=2733690 RepID=A0A8H7CSX4_9AGAR|nr:hypothetical protein MVEN_01460500 [Mycena venus]